MLFFVHIFVISIFSNWNRIEFHIEVEKYNAVSHLDVRHKYKYSPFATSMLPHDTHYIVIDS